METAPPRDQSLLTGVEDHIVIITETEGGHGGQWKSLQLRLKGFRKAGSLRLTSLQNRRALDHFLVGSVAYQLRASTMESSRSGFGGFFKRNAGS